MVIALTVLGAVLLVTVFACLIQNTRECAESGDGDHHWLYERNEEGLAVRCLLCGMRSNGIDVFQRTER